MGHTTTMAVRGFLISCGLLTLRLTNRIFRKWLEWNYITIIIVHNKEARSRQPLSHTADTATATQKFIGVSHSIQYSWNVVPNFRIFDDGSAFLPFLLHFLLLAIKKCLCVCVLGVSLSHKIHTRLSNISFQLSCISLTNCQIFLLPSAFCSCSPFLVQIVQHLRCIG